MEMQNSYNTYNGKRGLAYIIVNETFKARYGTRTGAEKDYENMKKVFKLLGFKLFPFKNQTAEQMKAILKKASQRKDLHQRSSFVCVISTHGGERSVGRSGGKTAKHEHFVVGSDSQHVETRTLIDMFSNSNCKGLEDKPKLFFIQACREDENDKSKKYDDGVVVQYKKNLNEIIKQRNRRDSADATSSIEDLAVSAKVCSTSPSGGNEDMENDDLWHDNYLEKYTIDTTDDESDGEDECRDKAKPSEDTSVTSTPERSSVLPTESDDREQMIKKKRFESELKYIDETDAEGKQTVDTDKSSIPEEVLECPCHDDMIVMFASPSGQFAWRNKLEGSWLLFCLHLVVLEHACKEDIEKTNVLSLLTEVLHKVSFRTSNTTAKISTGKKMVPVINHKLLKDVYFPVKKWEEFKSILKRMSP